MKNIFKSLMVCSMLCGGVMSVFGVRFGFVDNSVTDAVSDVSCEVSEGIQESVNVNKGETDEKVWKTVKERMNIVREAMKSDIMGIDKVKAEVSKAIREEFFDKMWNIDEGATDGKVWKTMKEKIEDSWEQCGVFVNDAEWVSAEGQIFEGEYKRMADRYSELIRKHKETLGAEQGKKCEEDTVDNDKE